MPPDPSAGRIDAAVAKARGVVGLYGDPTVSWSIGFDVALTSAVAIEPLTQRCTDLVNGRPHLGKIPNPLVFTAAESGFTLSSMLDERYADKGCLVRVALRDDGRQLLLAAHHGAVDGLGLLAALGILLDTSMTSSAQGIGTTPARVGFVKSSMLRLREAAFNPPSRLEPDPDGAPIPQENKALGDVLARRVFTTDRVDTVAILTAASQAFSLWNEGRGSGHGRIVAAVGASRRDGRRPAPDRDTAYLRVPLPPHAAEPDVRSRLLATSPEPSFPERRVGGWAGWATGALRARLGSSLFVSNLGRVESSAASVEGIAFFASAAGPRALAVSVVSTASCTTLTTRLPRADFTGQAADQICDLIVERLHRLADH